MKHIKLVLGVIAVMAAVLVVFAAPALVDDRHHNDRFWESSESS